MVHQHINLSRWEEQKPMPDSFAKNSQFSTVRKAQVPERCWTGGQAMSWWRESTLCPWDGSWASDKGRSVPRGQFCTSCYLCAPGDARPDPAWHLSSDHFLLIPTHPSMNPAQGYEDSYANSAVSPLGGDNSLLTMPRRASALSRSNTQSPLWVWELWAPPDTCSSHNHQQPRMSFTVKNTPVSSLSFILAV